MNINRAHFLRDLEDINWTEIVHIPDIDAKVEFFTSSLLQLYNKHAPYRSFVAKNHPTPWLNKEVKTLIKERNKAWRTYKRTLRAHDHEAYKHLRNRVKSTTRHARSMYFQTQFTNASTTTELWKCVNKLGLSRRANSTFTLPTHVDTVNTHFAGDPNPRCLRDWRPTVRISPDEQFYFKHVTEIDVAKAIFVSRSNTCGPDDPVVS